MRIPKRSEENFDPTKHPQYKKKKLTADEAKLLPQKYCKTHGKKYIIHKDFSLCCHNDCFPASVNKFMAKNRVYLHLRKLGMLNDLHSWLQMKLLEELIEKNKPPVLNFIWLFLKIRNFYTGVLDKGLVPNNDLPSGVKEKKGRSVPINEEIIAEIDDINAEVINGYTNRTRRRGDDTPERILLDHSLHKEIVDLTDNVMLAYLNEAINLHDVARIKGFTLSNSKKWVQQNLELLRKNIQK